MQFTQATALVALFSASAFGIALPQQNPPNGQNAGTNNGNNRCGNTTPPSPVTGSGPAPDRNDCQELQNYFLNAHKDTTVAGPTQLGVHGTCQLTATPSSGGSAFFGSDDSGDLVGTALAAWTEGATSYTGTVVVGINAQVPCDNTAGNTQVTVSWTLGRA